MTTRAQMIIRRVDGRDRPVGTIARSQALASGANFRVVHVLVINRHGEVLLQKIAESHDRHPGWWGSSVAGYVAQDETYPQAALRKLKEELGVTARPRLLGKTPMKDGESTKFVAVYALNWDGPIKPSPDDFGALCFVPFESMTSPSAARRFQLTPTFQHIIRFVKDAQLALRN